MTQEEYMAERVKRCVCKMCGGKLEQKVIVYNKYGGAGLELYCPHCQKVEYGTEPEIFAIAQEFVESMEFDYFTEMSDDKRHEQLNVAKMCEILSWVYRRMEVLDEDGLHIKWE